MKSQLETSVKAFAQQLGPSLTLRVGIDGSSFGQPVTLPFKAAALLVFCPGVLPETFGESLS
ncbi:MAG: hypothetical protein NT138_06265 [Planctomycetales bacterium]|nr:hypothetical protein [Planctomycetales bacterium]